MNSFSHGSKIELLIPGSDGMTVDEIHSAVSKHYIPIYTLWPKRQALEENAIVTDIYTVMQPYLLGGLTNCRPVKVNDSWILHGTLDYYGRDQVDPDALDSIEMIVNSIDRVRGDRNSGRILTSIEKLVFTPHPH